QAANPELSVPDAARPLRVPSLALRVGGSAVVEDSPVRAPGERPVRLHAEAGGILGAPARGVVARLGIDAGVDPAAAAGRPVILKLPEAVELLSGAADRVAVLVLEVAIRLPVGLLQHLAQIRTRGPTV